MDGYNTYVRINFTINIKTMSSIDKIRKKASEKIRNIVLPEAEKDIRVIEAANFLIREGLVNPILLGEKDIILKLAGESNVQVDSRLAFAPYRDNENESQKLEFFSKKLAHKQPTEDELLALCNNPLFTAGWMLATGQADASVAGSVASTGEVIVSALRTVGIAPVSSVVSSSFLMDLPDSRAFTYADCAVVPYPDSKQLASIAVDAGKTHQRLTQQEPVIAFLSFSTKGSAKHERVDLVKSALEMAKSEKPDWKMDGEFQFDTAIIPDIAKRKAPDSNIAGDANVFIFPNLDAGNIAYKITERLGGATATGPILQGLTKPYMDLSRGCSVDDIVNTACVASVLAG